MHELPPTHAGSVWALSQSIIMSKREKKGKKGKKGKKKAGDGLELSIEERLKKTNQEVDILKQQLVVRQEYAQRSKSRELAIKQDLEAAKSVLIEEKAETKDLTCNLTREYKTLQIKSETKIQMLEATVKRLTDELTSTKKELSNVTKERDLLRTQKESEVKALTSQVEAIQKSYESMIVETLDGLTAELGACCVKWDDESLRIEAGTQNLLEQFGNPLVHRRATSCT